MENFKLKNFTSLYSPSLYYNKGLGELVDSVCSPHTHEHEFKNHPSWNIGSDYAFINGEKTFKNTHPGIHIQEHIADFFYNLYNDKDK
jgi:hypothetical protein